VTYIGNFTLAGKQLFTAHMVASYSGVITAFKPGAFSLELNTRFASHVDGNEETIENYFEKKTPLASWEIRKLFEDPGLTSFDAFRENLETMNITATAFFVISGVKKGVIIAREAASVAHEIEISGKENDYIVITNFDYWNDDIRAFFDPSCQKPGHPRRLEALAMLDSMKEITSDGMFATINSKGVFAKDTILQARFNVEKGYANYTSTRDMDPDYPHSHRN